MITGFGLVDSNVYFVFMIYVFGVDEGNGGFIGIIHGINFVEIMVIIS